MRIKWGQDLVTGLLFIGIGLAALIIGWDYPRGTPQRPGTGVLPLILSCCLIGSGGILAVKSIAVDQPIAAWAWRPFFMVTLATVAFGLLIDDLGLVFSMVISLTLCAYGSLETRWGEYAVFLAIMIAIGVGTFIWLLGMPIPTWPRGVPSWLLWLVR